MSATAFQRKRREEASQLEESQQLNDVEPDQDGLNDDPDAKEGQQAKQQEGEQDDQKDDEQENQSIGQSEGQEAGQKEEVVETPTLDKLTNDQLKDLLEEKGIEYKKSATKAELIELLQGTDK